MRYIFLLILFFSLNFSDVNSERVTLGFSGDTCKNFEEGRKIDEEMFKSMFKSELMGFMSGYNLANAIKDRNNTKILDYNSIDYVYSNILEYCRKNKDKAVFIGIIKYINSQPKPK
tara:strand:- start:572 stop:919 length:348 start_codon:yes stop_codon:yes gene_type:complete